MSTARNDMPDWVIRPGSDEYIAAVAAFNRAVTPTPVGVVAAKDADDIAAAVGLAGSLGVTVAVQNTGHGITSDLDGSLLVDVRPMTHVGVDVERRLATVGPGVRWNQVLDAVTPHDLAGLAGSSPGVGVIGYTTGGGVGPLVRTLGIASDRVRALDVVTGDGVLRHVTVDQEPDLFWGLRGGRGLLGIVTSLEFDLLPIADLYGGAVFFDGADAPKVLHAWAEWTTSLPPEATTSIALLVLPDQDPVPPPLRGKLTVSVRFAWTGDDDSGAATLAPIRDVATPLLDSVKRMPYSALGSIHADPTDPMPFRDDHALLGEVTRETVDALLGVVGPDHPPVPGIVELRHLGGAIAESESDSAFCGRNAGYALTSIGPLAPPIADAVRARAAGVLEATRPWQVFGMLPTFGARAGREWLEQTYDADTLARLASASSHYDPDGTMYGVADLPR